MLPALLFCQAHGYAQPGPQPPCGREPVPVWPAFGDPATVKSWSKTDFARDWKPPACTGWTATGFSTLVATAARFSHASRADGLLRHAGAISELGGIRYWSTTRHRWQTLVVKAHAVTGLQTPRPRKDFTADEMKPGSVLYFEQTDNLSGKGIYKMRIAEASKDRVVYEVENAGPMRFLLVPVFGAGEMQTICFLDRESDTVWRYYSILRTGKNSNSRIAGNESSAINRAVAFYRALVGIPTDREPPAAR